MTGLGIQLYSPGIALPFSIRVRISQFEVKKRKGKLS